MIIQCRRLLICCLLSALWSVAVYAQAEVMTNADVLKLLDAGLSPQFIIKKLDHVETRFDLSTPALIELRNRGLSEEVILSMIDRQVSRGGAAVTGVSHSDSSGPAAAVAPPVPHPTSTREMISSASTIALVKSSAHPSRQALEKELMKRTDFRGTKLTITRYKDKADLYVEIGYVSLSWLTHRYVYRIYDRRSGTVLAAGETTSWGSLAGNLARNISRSLVRIG